MNKSLSKKILASVLAGAAVLTFAVTPYMPVSANEGTTQEQTMTVSKDGNPHRLGAKSNMFANRINQMVQDGKITSEQGTKLKNAMDEFRHKQENERKEFMKSLPDKTGISQDQLKEIFRGPNQHNMKGPQERLANLVKDGNVTQAEADAMNKFFTSHKVGSSDAPKSHEDAVKMMAEETGITSDRIEQIMNLMRPPMGPGPVIPRK